LSDVGDGEVINETPPENFFARHVKGIEDIGEPVNPCFFTNSQTDPTNWYSILMILFVGKRIYFIP